LRNELGYLNTNKARLHTPNIDNFSASAMVFEQAFAQIGVCGPSRNSFLSGRRPDTIKSWNFETDFRRTIGYNISSLPQAFKDHGWMASGMGKVYHPGLPK
jgi:iduronate 2-sulfatase